MLRPPSAAWHTPAMRLLAAIVVFVLTAAIVLAVAAGALFFGRAYAGVVFALLWSVAAATLSRAAHDPGKRHPLRWALLGLLFGPLPALWLAWQSAPQAIHAVRHVG